MALESKEVRTDNALIGAAGVYYVAMELSRRGMIALPTIRNTAGYDIIVTTRDGVKHANIQVKTSGKKANFWTIAKDLGSAHSGDRDYYVLVHRPSEAKGFEAYMLKGSEAKSELEAEHDRRMKREADGGTFGPYPLCIYITPRKSDLDPESKKTNWDRWRTRWGLWTLESGDKDE